MLVFGLGSGEVSLVDETNGETLWCEKRYDEVGTRGMSVACSPDGNCIASVDRSSRRWTLWDIDGTIHPYPKHGLMGWLEYVTFSPCNKLIAIISCEGRMKVYDTHTNLVFWDYYSDDLLYSASFSADSEFIAAVSKYGSVHIRYASTGNAFKNMDMGGLGEFCPINNNLFATTNGDFLALWNIETEAKIWNVKHGRDTFWDIQNFARFSPDGKTIATVQQDRRQESPDPVSDSGTDSDTEEDYEDQINNVLVVHTANGQTKFSLKHQKFDSVYEAAFSHDGNQLACVGSCPENQGFCVIWNMSDGNVIYRLYSLCDIRSLAWVSDMHRHEALAMALHERIQSNLNHLRIV
jgi:WD40 repeat protein